MVVWKATEKDTWASVDDDEVTPSSTPVLTPIMTPAPGTVPAEDLTVPAELAEATEVAEGSGSGAGEAEAAVPAAEGSSAVNEDEKQPPKRQVKREKAECVICFEEFEEGDIIARLECLCRYHKVCIIEKNLSGKKCALTDSEGRNVSAHGLTDEVMGSVRCMLCTSSFFSSSFSFFFFLRGCE